jgi:selenocysteine lyase/cysteine desulfurase
MLAGVAAALQEYARQKSRAEAGRVHHAAAVRRCKEALAQLLHATEGDIALLGSASEGVTAVSGMIDFRAGDNVVTNDLEFPSMVVPWLRLRSRGVEVRVVRHRNWDIPTEEVVGAVDGRTRLVALSHVSYVNGLRHDIAAVGSALRGTGAVFLVDATQALGVLPVAAACADFVVSSGYKWLLGVHGMGVPYWNRARRPDVEPLAVARQSVVDAFGPHQFERYQLKPDADGFNLGFVNVPAAYALGTSVPYLLAAGTEAVEAHVLDLGDLLIEGLNALRVQVITPAARARRGASVSFLHPRANQIGRALAERGIYLWEGHGRMRASLHLFNSAEDVERLLNALALLLRQG